MSECTSYCRINWEFLEFLALTYHQDLVQIEGVFVIFLAFDTNVKCSATFSLQNICTDNTRHEINITKVIKKP